MTEYERIHRARIEHAGELPDDEEDDVQDAQEGRCRRCGLATVGDMCETCQRRRDAAIQRYAARKLKIFKEP